MTIPSVAKLLKLCVLLKENQRQSFQLSFIRAAPAVASFGYYSQKILEINLPHDKQNAFTILDSPNFTCHTRNQITNHNNVVAENLCDSVE